MTQLLSYKPAMHLNLLWNQDVLKPGSQAVGSSLGGSERGAHDICKHTWPCAQAGGLGVRTAIDATCSQRFNTRQGARISAPRSPMAFKHNAHWKPAQSGIPPSWPGSPGTSDSSKDSTSPTERQPCGPGHSIQLRTKSAALAHSRSRSSAGVECSGSVLPASDPYPSATSRVAMANPSATGSGTQCRAVKRSPRKFAGSHKFAEQTSWDACSRCEVIKIVEQRQSPPGRGASGAKSRHRGTVDTLRQADSEVDAEVRCQTVCVTGKLHSHVSQTCEQTELHIESEPERGSLHAADCMGLMAAVEKVQVLEQLEIGEPVGDDELEHWAQCARTGSSAQPSHHHDPRDRGARVARHEETALTNRPTLQRVEEGTLTKILPPVVWGRERTAGVGGHWWSR